MKVLVINKILNKWKKRLGLLDWQITIDFRDARDLDGCTSKVILQKHTQHADMRILRQEDRQEIDPVEKDIEQDIVHELIHIRLWSIDPVDATGTLDYCREQAVDWISKALIASDRGMEHYFAD